MGIEAGPRGSVQFRGIGHRPPIRFDGERGLLLTAEALAMGVEDPTWEGVLAMCRYVVDSSVGPVPALCVGPSKRERIDPGLATRRLDDAG